MEKGLGRGVRGGRRVWGGRRVREGRRVLGWRWVGDGDGFGEGDGLGKGDGFRKGREGMAREARRRRGEVKGREVNIWKGLGLLRSLSYLVCFVQVTGFKAL